MNIVGIGIDAVKIERFKKAVSKNGENFLKRIFTEKELEYCTSKAAWAVHMSGKFAAKEAVKKALPNGIDIGLNWFDIEILNGKDGKPYAVLHGRAEKVAKKFHISQVLVSISHTRELAVSNAIGVTSGA